MVSLAIIGTAGRREDGNQLDTRVYDLIYATAVESIIGLKVDTLVSGGAAWADHLAVSAYLDNLVPRLILHFPAEFKNSKFLGAPRAAGRIANYYHKFFSNKTGINSLREIQRALDKGAEFTVSPGFHARNKLVGQTDYLLAYTFGTASGAFYPQDPGWHDSSSAGLKDGGTAHTWQHSVAEVKRHVNLNDI